MYVLKLGMSWHSLNKPCSTHLHVIIITWISNPSLDFSAAKLLSFMYCSDIKNGKVMDIGVL